MKDKYTFGRNGEQAVARQLRKEGASVAVSPGSRGAADLTADFASRTWLVQVKTSSTDKPGSCTRQELGRLKQIATRTGATAVVATKTTAGTEFRSARDGRLLHAPKGKK